MLENRNTTYRRSVLSWQPNCQHSENTGPAAATTKRLPWWSVIHKHYKADTDTQLHCFGAKKF